jgi:hypothetical protein
MGHGFHKDNSHEKDSTTIYNNKSQRNVDQNICSTTIMYDRLGNIGRKDVIKYTVLIGDAGDHGTSGTGGSDSRAGYNNNNTLTALGTSTSNNDSKALKLTSSLNLDLKGSIPVTQSKPSSSSGLLTSLSSAEGLQQASGGGGLNMSNTTLSGGLASLSLSKPAKANVLGSNSTLSNNSLLTNSRPPTSSSSLLSSLSASPGLVSHPTAAANSSSKIASTSLLSSLNSGSLKTNTNLNSNVPQVKSSNTLLSSLNSAPGLTSSSSSSTNKPQMSSLLSSLNNSKGLSSSAISLQGPSSAIPLPLIKNLSLTDQSSNTTNPMKTVIPSSNEMSTISHTQNSNVSQISSFGSHYNPLASKSPSLLAQFWILDLSSSSLSKRKRQYIPLPPPVLDDETMDGPFEANGNGHGNGNGGDGAVKRKRFLFESPSPDDVVLSARKGNLGARK